VEWLHHLWTPVLVFITGYVLARMAGKRAVSQMNAFDLIFIMIIGSSISEPIVSENEGLSVWYSFAIALLYLGISRLAVTNLFKNLLTTSPTVLIRKGDIDERGLKKSHLTVEELQGQLRIRGFVRAADVELATMEEGGQISVIPKVEFRPVQTRDLKLQTEPEFIAIPLISDGEIIRHNLKYLQKDEEWLYRQMELQHIPRHELPKITQALYDQQGKVSFDTFTGSLHDQDPDYYKPGDQN
jgi:uncharacterized membrane protein YcaP (DUF421 family)